MLCFQNSLSAFDRLVGTDRVDAAAVLRVRGSCWFFNIVMCGIILRSRVSESFGNVDVVTYVAGLFRDFDLCIVRSG